MTFYDIICGRGIRVDDELKSLTASGEHINNKAKLWLEIADDDLDTAKSLMGSKKYRYIGFMCQQAVEKALKAVIQVSCAEGEMPPKIHSLVRLANLASVASELSDEQKNLIENISPMSIEARYPEYKERVLGSATTEDCERFIEQTGELLCWIKKRLWTMRQDTPTR
jgi:HEPN domain-containing protein